MSKKRLLLKGPENWDTWIEFIKSVAMKGGVWEMVDPNQAELECTKLTEPSRPAPSTVRSGDNVKYSDLDDSEKEYLLLLQKQYSYDLRRYNQEKLALGRLRVKIQETVHHDLLDYTLSKDSVYHILRSLRDYCYPTDAIRELELTQRWRELQVITRGTDIEAWLIKWETTYEKCVQLKLPHVHGTRASYDFIHAISEVSFDTASFWLADPAKIEQTPVKTLVKHFRNLHRMKLAQDGISTDANRSNRSSTPTLHDRSAQGNRNRRRTTCVCGQQHHFLNCPYYNPTIRTKDWVGDAEIQAKANQLVKKFNWLRTGIERGTRKAGGPK